MAHTPTTDNRPLTTAAGLFLLVLVPYAFFFNGGGWNQNAHFDLTRAIVEQRTFAITDANSGDVSTGIDGRLYANKAPGASFLGVIPYAALHVLGLTGNPNNSMYAVTAATNGVCGALIAVVLYLYAVRRLGVSRTAALAVSLVIAFGTYVFGYATVYFAHVPCALFLLLAVVLLEERPLLAGACAGIAGMTFYVAIPAAAILVIVAATRSWRDAARFVAGGIPFGMLLGWYHQVCFGKPWQTAVETSTAFIEEDLLFGVLARPKLAVLESILFSRYRGLLPLSPVLLFAVIGIVVMIRKRIFLRELAAAVTIVILFLAANASFNGWNGGAAIGPRYVLPIVPLLAIPMLFAARFLGRGWLLLWVPLAAFSIGANFLAAAVDVMPGDQIADPLGQYIVPVFLHAKPPFDVATDGGHVNVNPQDAADKGLEPPDPTTQRAKWASFNLGEFVTGQGSPWSVAPIVLWMLGGSWWLMRRARARV